MRACMFTVDISNSNLPQLFTGLYTVLCTATVVHCVVHCVCVLCTCEVGVANARGGDTTRLAGVCL